MWYKSVHNRFSYRGHRQTHKPTPVKTYSLAFAGRTSMCCGRASECLSIRLSVCLSKQVRVLPKTAKYRIMETSYDSQGL